MGVEYRHFLVVADPGWVPAPDTTARVDAVLRRWLLVDGDARLVDPGRPDAAPITGAISAAGVAVRYTGATARVVAEVLGPSMYPDVDERDRYIEQVVLVHGLDFRIVLSDELVTTTVIEPPRRDGIAVDAYEDLPWGLELFDAAYPADARTTPPIVEVEIADEARHHLSQPTLPGAWRGALVIDCGKDVPAFAAGVHRIPNRRFVDEIAEAIRGSLVEIGNFY